MSTGPEDGGAALPAIESVETLLAHAHALESEAAERYAELAAQMDTHHSPELAVLFRKMAAIEAKHVDKVEAMAAACELPRLNAWDYGWPDAEAPETTPFSAARYGMTAHQALSRMLDNEKRAVAFFDRVAGGTSDAEVRSMAAALADEERDHVALLQAWLERYPPSERAETGPGTGWDDDPDDPVSQA